MVLIWRKKAEPLKSTPHGSLPDVKLPEGPLSLESDQTGKTESFSIKIEKAFGNGFCPVLPLRQKGHDLLPDSAHICSGLKIVIAPWQNFANPTNADSVPNFPKIANYELMLVPYCGTKYL